MLPFAKLSGTALVGLVVLSTFGDARSVPQPSRLHRRFTFAAKHSPEKWATEQLEDYQTYHFRYLAISCHTQHKTDFFEACCHPRLKTQTDADFPAQCSLSASSLSTASKIVAESAGDDEDTENDSFGKPVYVPAGSVVALKPVVVDGKNTTLPPTEEELAAIAKVKATIGGSGSEPGSKGRGSGADSAPSYARTTSSASIPASTSTSTSTSTLTLTTPEETAPPSGYSTPAKQSTPTHSPTPKEPSYTPTPPPSTTPSTTPTPTSTYDWHSAQSVQSVASVAAAASAASEAAAAARASASEAAAAAAKASASKAAAAAATTSSSSYGGSGSSSSGGFSGASQIYGSDGDSHATFFYQNGNAGACGKVNPDSATVIALYTSLYANGAHCGKKVLIKNTANGKEVYATVADECPTCTTPTSIDLSIGAYDQIGEQSTGVLPIEWAFVN